MEYTPEHFEELHDRNENFDGRVADFGKFATYNQIKTALVDFMQRCDEVERIDEQSPIPHIIRTAWPVSGPIRLPYPCHNTCTPPAVRQI